MLVKNANFLKKRQISSFVDTLRALIFAKQILATKGFNNYEFCGTKFCGINFHVWVTFIHFAENFADFAEFLLRLRMFFGSFAELNFAIKDASINFFKVFSKFGYEKTTTKKRSNLFLTIFTNTSNT